MKFVSSPTIFFCAYEMQPALFNVTQHFVKCNVIYSETGFQVVAHHFKHMESHLA